MEGIGAPQLLQLLQGLPPYIMARKENQLLRCNLVQSVEGRTGAVKCLDDLLALKPKMVEAHFQKARLLMESRQQQAAIEALEKGLEIDPNDPQALELYRFLKTRNWEKAR